MTFTIRNATENDIGDILTMIKEHADYVDSLHEVTTDKATLRKSLFCENPHARALMMEKDGKTIGITIFFYSFSTWLGKYGIYVEDIYIRDAYRGKGYGKKMFQYIAKLACNEDCRRIEWSALKSNDPAIKFYKKNLSAVSKDQWTMFKLEGDAISELAAL